MPTTRRRFPPIAAALLALLPIIPSGASAQVRRCTAADGSTVFTDRRCEDIGATARLPRQADAVRSTYAYRGGCARTLPDLVHQLGAAIDSGDANRVAALYHWTGMSSRTGYAVMARLDSVARRPLVDIVPVHPRQAVTVQNADGTTSEVDPDYYPQVRRNRPPVALRVEQTLANGSTPSRTVFALRRHLDCWWIAL